MSRETALALIESIKDYRVLFVGETISDEYQYVTALGKSPKEHLIPVLYKGEEVFKGGVIAAANHLRTFCKTVDVCTGVKPVRKVRFVEESSLRKLFEIQHNDTPPGEVDGCLKDDYDVVVVCDFGHNYITSEMRQRLCKMPFVAVNAQTNSSNIGFNLITRYPRADFIVIDEPEARLAAADRTSGMEEVMRKLSKNRCPIMCVTHGRHGAYGYERGFFMHLPAVSEHPLDTMGAGDAFFSITAPMAKTGTIYDLLLIGNAAGALKVQIPGHRKSVTKEALCDFIRGA